LTAIAVEKMADSLKRRRWIFVIAFWISFAASIGMVRRYPWIDSAWNGLWLLLMIVAAVYSVREMFRRGHRTGEYVYTRGVPRSLWWIFSDDDDSGSRERASSKKTEK
jgi:hypothetical protein